MSAFTVRPVTGKDRDALAALLQRSYATLLAPDYTPEILAQALPLITRPNPDLLAAPTYYVAEAPNGRLIGCGGWTHKQPGSGQTEPATGNIRHFAVDPDAVRQGVGRALIKRSLQDARANDVDRMECFSSRTAVPFYEACGFHVLEPVDVHLTEDCAFPSVHMVCELNA